MAESRSEVLRSNGAPFAILSPRTSQTFPPEDRDRIQAVSGFTYDLYTRFFGGLEYEMRVAYKPDTTASCLHPTERVSAVRLIPDRGLPFVQLAASLPWTRTLCEVQCNMLGVLSGRSYEVFIYPLTVNTGDAAVAEAVAQGFANAPLTQQYRPCLTVTFQETRPVASHDPLPAFNSLTVDDISVGVCNPEFEKRMSQLPVKESLLPAYVAVAPTSK